MDGNNKWEEKLLNARKQQKEERKKEPVKTKDSDRRRNTHERESKTNKLNRRIQQTAEHK